ncbi:MAG: gluconate 2-dehydrogenase subunit 3 family protein [Alphaproteobacteria bacterium]|nr:gluconate 2-dehydrogenase subunit 3 family protein [Alphaproteobacteria bacterium]
MNILQKSGHQFQQLSREETAILHAIAETVIPASHQYDLPSAGDAPIFSDILATSTKSRSELHTALSVLDDVAYQVAGTGFAALTVTSRLPVGETFRKNHPQQAMVLETLIVQCYYRDDRVMRSLGMEARAPFPKGFVVEQGDWSLLDPVRKRNAFYRPAP